MEQQEQQIVTRSKTLPDKQLVMDTPIAMSELMKQMSSMLDEKLDTFEVKMKKTIKDEIQNQLSDVTSKVDDLQKENEMLSTELTALKQDYDVIMGGMRSLSKEVKEIRLKCIANEQYSRKKNIRVFGLPEEQGENCRAKLKNLFEELDVSVDAYKDVSNVHRIGSKNSPKPMIVAFASHDTKITVLKSRKALKGKTTSISDDLCVDLTKTLNRLKTDHRVKDAWSWDGKLYAKRKDDLRVARVHWGQTYDEMVFRDKHK